MFPGSVLPMQHTLPCLSDGCGSLQHRQWRRTRRRGAPLRPADRRQPESALWGGAGAAFPPKTGEILQSAAPATHGSADQSKSGPPLPPAAPPRAEEGGWAAAGASHLDLSHCGGRGTPDPARKTPGKLALGGGGVLVGAQVPVLSANDHPNPSQGRQKCFGKSRNVKNFQVSLNSLRNSNFGAFGGPMAWAT